MVLSSPSRTPVACAKPICQNGTAGRKRGWRQDSYAAKMSKSNEFRDGAPGENRGSYLGRYAADVRRKTIDEPFRRL